MDFRIKIDNIKIAGNEESVSKTIEELLALNKRIPSRSNKEVVSVTEKQFEDNNDYKAKKTRGEVLEVTEKQLSNKKSGDFGIGQKDEDYEIVEIRATSNKDPEYGILNRSEAWDKDDQEVRGHKKNNIQPIWVEVYNLEDKRNGSPMDKKLDK